MKSEKSLENILISLLYFVMGVIFIAATDELLTTFNYILVSICAVLGVLQILGFFIRKKYENGYSDILLGVVLLCVSLILYVYYRIMINILPILFSLYLFIMGFELIVKYMEHRGEYKFLILGILALVIGLLLIFNPGSVIYIYLKITGVYLIFVAMLYLIDYVRKSRQVWIQGVFRVI